VHETPTIMYVLTVVHGSRNDILLRIRPGHEESPMCLADSSGGGGDIFL